MPPFKDKLIIVIAVAEKKIREKQTKEVNFDINYQDKYKTEAHAAIDNF